MKKMRLLWLIPVVLILAVGGYFFVSRTQAANVQSVKLERGTISAVVDADGTMRANQTARIFWLTSGKVSDVKVKLGDRVKANDVLAVLEPTSMNANIIQAQADLASANQALDDLMNSTTQQALALQDMQDAQTALDNYNSNFPAIQAKAQADLLTAQTNLKTMTDRRTRMNYARASQGDIDAAQASYDLAQKAVDDAQKAYNQIDYLKPSDPRLAAALVNLSNAEKKRDAALANLNWYTGNPTKEDISKADANLGQAKATLAQAQDAWNKVKDGPDAAQLAVLNARLTDAQRQYERVKNGPSDTDIQSAKGRIVADQATLSVGQLTAPFDGTITEVDVMVGDLVTPGNQGFQVDDKTSQYVDLKIPEADINKVELGQSAVLTFDGVPGKQYNGIVDKIGLVGKTNAGEVDYTVSVKLTDADSKVRQGMTVSASIIVGEKKDALLVPNKAIRTVDNQNVIDVRRGDQVTPVVIQVGLASDTQTEILSGDVKAGDEVMVN